MRKRILSALLVLIFYSGCQNARVMNKIKESYKQSVSFFDSSLVTHFPMELPDSVGLVTNVPSKDTIKLLGFGVDELMLWKKYDSIKYNELKSHFVRISQATYQANDSSLLLIFPYSNVVELDGRVFDNQESPLKQKLAEHNITKAKSLPVPLFNVDEFKGKSFCGLNEGFRLYVLGAESGKFLPASELQDCECLPKKWKHGYSKGVALNDKQRIVIYWIIAW